MEEGKKNAPMSEDERLRASLDWEAERLIGQGMAEDREDWASGHRSGVDVARALAEAFADHPGLEEVRVDYDFGDDKTEIRAFWRDGHKPDPTTADGERTLRSAERALQGAGWNLEECQEWRQSGALLPATLRSPIAIAHALGLESAAAWLEAEDLRESVAPKEPAQMAGSGHKPRL